MKHERVEVINPDLARAPGSSGACAICGKVAQQMIGVLTRPEKLCLKCYREAFHEWHARLNGAAAPLPAATPALPPAKGNR